jgi:hypothetical protein
VLRDACVGMGIVVLGVCGENRREKAFWVLWRGELETTDLGSGTGMHSSVHSHFYYFQSPGVGVLLALEDMSSPRSETEWTDLFTRPLRTHHLIERGVRAELSSASAELYLPAG